MMDEYIVNLCSVYIQTEFWIDEYWTKFCVVGADEVKGIEFTVTTLNCQHEVATTPEPRRRFSSLRKTGALSKAVRSKISKSFYTIPSENNKKNDKNVIAVAATDDEKSKRSTADSDDNIDTKKMPLATTKSASSLSTATSASNAKPEKEKRKKRSKLCQLLWPKLYRWK